MRVRSPDRLSGRIDAGTYEAEVRVVTKRAVPTVRRRRLGAELRTLREKAGYTLDSAAEQVRFSTSKISRIETGLIGATSKDLNGLLTLYGVPSEKADAVNRLAWAARQKDW